MKIMNHRNTDPASSNGASVPPGPGPRGCGEAQAPPIHGRTQAPDRGRGRGLHEARGDRRPLLQSLAALPPGHAPDRGSSGRRVRLPRRRAPRSPQREDRPGGQRGEEAEGRGAPRLEDPERAGGLPRRSPSGPALPLGEDARPAARKVLDQVREAFGLGFVDELWPDDEEPRLDLAMLVNRTLLRGAVPKQSGNPKVISEGTRAARAELEGRVLGVARRIEREWKRRMKGVDVHALRKTHRSWAQARGVPPVLIDKQLGHADPGEFEVMRALAGSETGRKHYLDLESELFDAGRSAQAVRDLLDEVRAWVASASLLATS